MLPSNTLLPLASLDLGKKNDEKALACLYLFLLFTEYHNKAMRFNYQNIFLFFSPTVIVHQKYTMNITGGVLAKSLESVIPFLCVLFCCFFSFLESNFTSLQGYLQRGTSY